MSFKTVSRVVNEEGGVSDALLTRVQDAVAELGYRPDERARRLRQQTSATSTIGFVHADMANPFFGSIHTGLQEIAMGHDHLILTATSDDSFSRQDDIVSSFARRRVDGLVVVPASDSTNVTDPRSALAMEISRGTPVVFIDRESDLVGDHVLGDHEGGGVVAATHLMNAGHQRLAIIGDRLQLDSATKRRNGFRQGLAVGGLAPVREIMNLESAVDAEQAVVQLMSLPSSERPTALFAAHNYLTSGTVRALHHLGMQHQVALVGFDDLDLLDVLDPGVTVVAQDPQTIGRRAGECLFDRLASDIAITRRELIDVALTPRGSGEIQPC